MLPTFFFNSPATADISTLSLHDALPISGFTFEIDAADVDETRQPDEPPASYVERDRKSTRLNSSHVSISYAVFCLKKKNRKAELLGGAPGGDAHLAGHVGHAVDAGELER